MENQKVETVQGVREVFGNMPDAAQPVKNANAVALGAKAYGRPKTLTPEERARRSEHMKRVTADRIAKRAAAAGPVQVTEAGPVIPAPSSVPETPAPSSPAPRVVRYVSVGKPRTVAPSSRAYPARRS